MSRDAVAVVGTACRYPGARSPRELWEASLAGRRAFRRIPPGRLRLEDYGGAGPDSVYLTEAAVLEDWSFDRVGFRVAGSSHRAADLAHWLALEVATAALEDAGFPGGEGLPRAETGVLVGNSLTGEFSRAQQMRLRWPYVRRTVGAALAAEGWKPEAVEAFLGRLEASYKEPFPEPGEETLAGGLANTIAGRIANRFDLKGGGYTVDGACASSLLAIANACSALAAGDLEVVLAGGVDLSLDPFELVGFSRAGAFARDRMRVFDARSAGFLPGEGCGFVVLMGLAAAQARGLRVHGVIRGWGISSDGAGGLTRPEPEGQLLALERAYRRAGFGPETVSYFEGHGTGTAVGDAAELTTLSRARRAAGAAATGVPPAAVGSVKALIGHTKAAAGVAGLIRTVEALVAEVLPPAVGCEEPHPLLREGDDGPPVLRAPRRAEPWPEGAPLRAGVSAMGFGGINAHVVLEAPAPGVLRNGPRVVQEGPRALPAAVRRLDASRQDAELLVLAAPSTEALAARAEELAREVEGLSYAELADLAGELAVRPCGLGSERVPAAARGAVVATRPLDAAARLRHLAERARRGEAAVDAAAGIFLRAGTGEGAAARPPRIGFLFPGQGSPAHLDGGAWVGRFEEVEALYADAWGPRGVPEERDGAATEVAQPAIVLASAAALAVLGRLRIEAHTAVGHSLGELSALHWSGRLDARELVTLARERGRAMAAAHDLVLTADGLETGAMASLPCDAASAGELIAGTEAVLAGFNGPRRTVVSGPAAAVSEVERRARGRGLESTRLQVSHAFHSPLMAGAAPELAAAVAKLDAPPAAAGRTVVSTVTGAPLAPDADLDGLLVRQLTAPVRFHPAVERAQDEVDLWLEVGPGRVLTGLVQELAGPGKTAPAVAVDASGPGLGGLLSAVAAAFVLGAPVAVAELFRDRVLQPPGWRDRSPKTRFLSNPCEEAPLPAVEGARTPTLAAAGTQAPPEPVPMESNDDLSAVELVRRVVARRAELPESAVGDASRMLSDLHLSSIAVGQLVAEAARRLGARPPATPTDYADASVAEVAAVLEEAAAADGGEPELFPPGVEAWVRPFADEWVGRPAPSPDGAPALRPRLFAPADDPVAAALRWEGGEAAAERPIVVCLPAASDPEALRLLLEAGKCAIAEQDAAFVLVHRGWGAGFARSLHLERRGGTTVIVGLPAEGLPPAEAAARVRAEVAAASSGAHAECRYDAAGRRLVPVLRPLTEEAVDGVGEPAAPLDLTPADVVLVSGGGRGIAAECALALARETGATLALLGRSLPEESPELAANLERFAAAGARFAYRAADVTDPAAVECATAELEAELGPVTALLHGAGTNRPRRLAMLTEEDLAATLAPKVDGLRNLLAALDPGRLRLLVAFGSIIARTGMAGQADYALANELLARGVERFAAGHPGCRCLTPQWSVWSGLGMGERLGTLESLVGQGISPIAPERGIEALRGLLARPRTPVSVVVAGRFGAPPTVELDRSELPFLRFLERSRFHVPGVELVVEAEVGAETDPYLADHVYAGERLFPAVLGLEAMAQAAVALAGEAGPTRPTRRPALRPRFRDVRFDRPVVVPAGGRVTLRVAALSRPASEGGGVDVALRSSETGFQVDHFRAVCDLSAAPAGDYGAAALLPPATRPELDPGEDLYGSFLFHGGRFRRLVGYRHLRATACAAEIGADGAVPWFGRYLPGTLLLGDPGARDAAVHAVQACVPHATVLPTSVERLSGGFLDPAAAHTVEARERSGDGRSFVYDLVVRDAAGRVVERWDGLGLRAVDERPAPAEWPVPLLAPYLERRIAELVPGAALSVGLEPAPDGRGRGGSGRAIEAVVAPATTGREGAGERLQVLRRPDGRPELAAGNRSGEPPAVAAAHAAGLVLAVAGSGPTGCDAEPVAPRPSEAWRDLLGPERAALAELLVRETGDDEDTAATRVWTAVETLRKAGLPSDAPLVLDRDPGRAGEGWVVLRSGRFVVPSLVTRTRGAEAPLALAFLARPEAG